MGSTLRHIFFYLLATKVVTIESQATTGEEYRLPNMYIPLSYQINITVTPEVFTDTKNEFSGAVQILFSTTTPTNLIPLHAQHDFITINRVTLDDTEVSYYTVNNVTDILTINATSEIGPEDTHSLLIDYTSVFSTSDMYGFYKSNYQDENGNTKHLLMTMFAATYARRAFPCFDEPAMKATFDFSITVPKGLKVLFNTYQRSSMDDDTTGLSTINFYTTPKMSTYLVAWTVSEFTCTFGASVGTLPYRVCSRNGSEALRDVALEFGYQLLGSLDNYTGYDYELAMQKIDQVAVPDFAANAMENWGLITYRETALLWDSNESSNRYKQRVVTVMAHEFAHQWFGDLVTLNWWSEIFLNEGFATYFEYHITHEVLPQWELDKQFVIEKLHAALLSDALENAHALQSECFTPAEISARFSTISYSKGGSILRMVEHFMKQEHFKPGIQNYIQAYQFQNAQPEDLWLSLNASVLESVTFLPADFTTVMENWIKKSGYPLLTVTVSGDDVTISQERFLFSGEDLTTKWYVPISYSISLDPDKFGRTSPILWLIPDHSETFALPKNCDWIILNNQQSSYYRVNYDDSLWKNISAALLKDNFDGITDLNRAQIVDDLFNLARADKFKYSKVLDAIEFLANDISYYSWYPAYSGFDFLLMRVGEDSYLGKTISAKILELMSELYASVPISNLNEGDQMYTLKQVLALTWACRLGHENCIQHVLSLFSHYKITGERPNKNLRSIVYCSALKYSNDTSDWEFLWEAYGKASALATEQVTILSSLGCTKDEVILKEYLNKSITDGYGIRTQDALSVFSSVYAGSSNGVDVAFEFLMENYEEIAEKYNSMNSLGKLIKGIAERFTTERQNSRLRIFIESGNLPEEFRVSAKEALEIAETNLKWMENFEDDLIRYFDNAGCRVLGPNIFVIVMLVVLFLLNSP